PQWVARGGGLMFISRCTGVLVGSVVAFLAFTGAAPADTIFTTFGPGNSYNSGVANVVSDTQINQYQFAVVGNFSVTQIDLAVAYFGDGSPNGVIVSLLTDNANFAGTALGSWSLSPLPLFSRIAPPVQTITGITGIELATGLYWLQVAPLSPGGHED